MKNVSAVVLQDQLDMLRDCGDSRTPDACGECLACRDATVADLVQQKANAEARVRELEEWHRNGLRQLFSAGDVMHKALENYIDGECHCDEIEEAHRPCVACVADKAMQEWDAAMKAMPKPTAEARGGVAEGGTPSASVSDAGDAPEGAV